MKLFEMFSPIGAPKENDEIDWVGDLKFFVDNDNSILNRFIFPAVVRHERCVKDPDAYKIYLNPIRECVKIYSEKYDIVDPQLKFTKQHIVALCKQIAEEQKNHILKGDYKQVDEDQTTNETILKGGYRLLSKKTGRNLGTFPTRAGAVERERQVQFFKHRGK
jgi:hypothetical protein